MALIGLIVMLMLLLLSAMMLSCRAHGPHLHPLTKLAHIIPSLRISESIVPHEEVEWDDKEGPRLLTASREPQTPQSSVQTSQKTSQIDSGADDPLPPVLLATNCSKAHGFSGPGSMYCNVTWSGVKFPAADDLLACYVPADVDPSKSIPVQVTSVLLPIINADKH
jgi:hypothetical protein